MLDTYTDQQLPLCEWLGDHLQIFFQFGTFLWVNAVLERLLPIHEYFRNAYAPCKLLFCSHQILQQTQSPENIFALYLWFIAEKKPINRSIFEDSWYRNEHLIWLPIYRYFMYKYLYIKENWQLVPVQFAKFKNSYYFFNIPRKFQLMYKEHAGYFILKNSCSSFISNDHLCVLFIIIQWKGQI